MAVKSVLVVGAGPAGMTAAIAMTRRGIHVELVEQEATFGAVGVGILLQNSPLRALDSLGLVDEIARRGYPHSTVSMRNVDGDVLMTLQPPPLVPGKPATIAISRGVLAEILADAVVAEGIVTRFGQTVSELDDDGRAVHVTFSDGSRSSYDLVVGADGINSHVRSLLPGIEQQRAEYSGQCIWRVAAPRAGIAEYQLLQGPISKIGLVPISEGRMYIYLVEAFPQEPTRDELGDFGEAFARASAPFGGDVPRVVAGIDSDFDFRALKFLLVDDPWFRGRIIVLGDAAHATTPHIAYGLGISVEDGIVLAETLADADDRDDLSVVLSRFMARRFARAKLVVENAHQLSLWEQVPPEDPAAYAQLMGDSLRALSQPI